MPGFDAEGFEGLGEEQIVLRPHQGEQRRASQMERAAAERGGFEESQGELFASVKRKKSKYNGTLVNTFPEGLQGVSPVSASVSHPSIRYQVLCHMVSPERKWMIASALSGELDSRLYDIYQEASGGEDILNIKESGDNGRVRLSVDTGSGVSTEADLGGSLDTGYVVQSIDDPLGIFPEGTEQGDFLEFGTVEVILKSLADTGERDVDADGSWSYDDGVVDSIGSMFIRSAASPGDHIELRFQSDDGSSNKFINMDYSGGPSFSATWGRIGSAGRVTEYPASQWDSYYRQKVAKGYTDVSDGEPLVVRELPRQAPTKKLPSPQLQPNLRKPKPRATQLELFASRRPQISSRFFSGR
jgi:predicted DNA-binding WGR domain protein